MNKGTPPDDRVTLVFEVGSKDIAFCDPCRGPGWCLRWHKRHVDHCFELSDADGMEVAPVFRSAASWPESYRWCELPGRLTDVGDDLFDRLGIAMGLKGDLVLLWVSMLAWELQEDGQTVCIFAGDVVVDDPPLPHAPVVVPNLPGGEDLIAALRAILVVVEPQIEAASVDRVMRRFRGVVAAEKARSIAGIRITSATFAGIKDGMATFDVTADASELTAALAAVEGPLKALATMLEGHDDSEIVVRIGGDVWAAGEGTMIAHMLEDAERLTVRRLEPG